MTNLMPIYLAALTFMFPFLIKSNLLAGQPLKLNRSDANLAKSEEGARPIYRLPGKRFMLKF